MVLNVSFGPHPKSTPSWGILEPRFVGIPAGFIPGIPETGRIGRVKQLGYLACAAGKWSSRPGPRSTSGTAPCSDKARYVNFGRKKPLQGMSRRNCWQVVITPCHVPFGVFRAGFAHSLVLHRCGP